jgi:hypothetical protein
LGLAMPFLNFFFLKLLLLINFCLYENKLGVLGDG